MWNNGLIRCRLYSVKHRFFLFRFSLALLFLSLLPGKIRHFVTNLHTDATKNVTVQRQFLPVIIRTLNVSMNCASVVHAFRSYGVGWWGFPQKYRDFGKRSKIAKSQEPLLWLTLEP